MNIFLNTKKRYDSNSFRYVWLYRKKYNIIVIPRLKFIDRISLQLGERNMKYYINIFKDKIEIFALMFGLLEGNHTDTFLELCKETKYHETHCSNLADSDDIRLIAYAIRKLSFSVKYGESRNLMVIKKYYLDDLKRDTDGRIIRYIEENNLPLIKLGKHDVPNYPNMISSMYHTNISLIKTFGMKHISFRKFKKK